VGEQVSHGFDAFISPHEVFVSKRYYEQSKPLDESPNTVHILGGGTRGRVVFVVDSDAKTVRVTINEREPSLKTTIEIGRRLWYLFVAQGFTEIK
jgi:hypothetical protein